MTIEKKDVPESILNTIDPYQKKGERLDVCPVRFDVAGNRYYYFAFLPAGDRLVVKEDGEVPLLDDIKHVHLVAGAFITAGEALLGTGLKWAKSSAKKKYQKLLDLLRELEKQSDLSSEIENDLETFKQAVATMIKEQDNIYEIETNGVDYGDDLNKKEICTEEDQKQMRQYVIDLVWAATRQNDAQLKTEHERDRVMDYLSSKRWSHPKLFYYYMKLKPHVKNMLTADSPEMKEMEQYGKEMDVNVPLEEQEGAEKAMNSLRNPRT